MPEHADPYASVIEAAVEREMDMIGERRAIELARCVEGLSIDDDGEVLAVGRPGVTVLEDLVREYTEASGEIAAFVVARRIETRFEVGDLELPSNVARHL